MNLVAKKRTLLPSTIVAAALALGCGFLAAQAAPLTASSQLLAQAEPQKPGEERRKEQQPAPPKGAQPQVQPQRPGPQSAQPPQGPQRTQQDRRPVGAQGQPPGTSQQQERQERRPPPGGPQPGQPRTTQQPTAPSGVQREPTQQERRQPPGTQPGGPAQPRTTQQPTAPSGAQREPTQQERRQPPGTQPGGPTQPRTTQQPGQVPGTQPGPGQPRTTQQPGQPPGAPARPQTTQQPGGQPPGAPRRDQRQDTQRPPAPGTPIGPQNARPGQPQPGAPGAPAAGDQRGPQQFETMRQQRQERTENNGQRTVIEEPDHRMIIRENGRAFVRHDEVARFRLTGQDVRVERRGGEIVTLVRRPGDVEIVTYVDENGRLLRRVRRTRDGREFVLIDNRMRGPAGVEIFVSLPPPRIVIPRDEYIVEMEYAPRERIFAALEAPPIEPIERAYTLDEVRFSPTLRDRMRRVDLDTINFEFGSWQVAPDQISLLANIAEAINQVVGRNPNEVFLIEGHTDAVGNDVDNLSLSDRRAESVAVILTQNFQVPPENLTTQGYGAQQLKVQTPGPSRENRRVTIRRITPLLTGSSQ
jgi:outer membrane protein OmpA-like peptidoglycan-associated protein